MEKWKIAAIAALLLSFVGYGAFSNSRANQTLVSGTPNLPGVQQVSFTAPKPSKYDGRAFPAWTGVNQWMNTSTPPTLSALKGHPTLVEVFRIECSHCQKAAPFLVSLHARYGPRGVNFVGIQSPVGNADPNFPENSWLQVQSWVKGKGYTWPVGFDPKRTWFTKSFGKDLWWPSLFLLDANGKVVYFCSGHDDAKALQLAVQLERLAPGKGNSTARSSDVLKWIETNLEQRPDAQTEQSLKQGIASYFGSNMG